MALVLGREFEVLPTEIKTDIEISFYPEEAAYVDDTKPMDCHHLTSSKDAIGNFQLPYRVIGKQFLLDRGKDLVVKITVDGVRRCFCKAKRPQAKNLGVKQDFYGDVFYIDSIILTEI